MLLIGDYGPYAPGIGLKQTQDLPQVRGDFTTEGGTDDGKEGGGVLMKYAPQEPVLCVSERAMLGS